MALRPLAPPPVSPKARAAAVQGVGDAPSSAVVGRQRGKALDSRYVGAYQDWQDWARRYVRTLGAARFASSIVSDTCSRCEIRIEERDGKGDWDETGEARLSGVMDAYRNEHLGQDAKELIRTHSHHYQVAGEMVQVTIDGDFGIDYRIYSIRACDFNKPQHGQVTIRDVPNGTVRAGTAFVVPAAQVVRFWIPDEEWPGLATSPMAAGMEDLHRYASIVRFMRRTAESKLALGGKILWTAGEAHDEKRSPDDRVSRVMRDYLDMAKIGLDDDSDIRAAVPPMMHWKKEWGKPEAVDIATPFDKDLLAGAQNALEDFARGINLPSSVVTSGGSANQNHWNEWLIDERFFDSGIAWVMNAITHRDITRTFLWPLLRMIGLPRDRFRVGYDPTPVIIRPDRSEKALLLHKQGLLAAFPTLEANGFDPDQAMGVDDLNRLLQVLSAGKVQPEGGPPEAITVREQVDAGGTVIDPSSVDKAPPTRPMTTRDAVPPMASSITASAARRANLTDRVRITNRVLKRVAKIRRDVGAKLHARAQQAYSDAVDQAARTAANKIRRRHDQRKISDDLARRALDAVQTGRDAGPLLAAVGMTESELLDARFQGFQTDAAALLRRANEQQREALADAGIDDRLYAGDDGTADAGAAFLAAGALSLARSRLTTGDAVTPTAGEISGSIPASLAVQAVQVGAGERRAVFGETPDDRPQAVDADGSLIDALSADLAGDLGGDQLGLQVEYTWVYGANGEPERPYEPHAEIDTETSTDPENDWPAVDDFTDFDYLWPQDHDGCSCAVDQQFVLPEEGGGEAGVGYGGMPEGQPGE